MSNDPKTVRPADSEAVSKLLKQPVEFELQVGGQPVQVWLAPLSYQERIHVNASANEAYRILSEAGAEHHDALAAATIAIISTSAYYSVRRGPHRDSPRMFETPVEVTLLNFDEVSRAMEKQAAEFTLTEAELGNCLRARATTYTTSQPSPASSPA